MKLYNPLFSIIVIGIQLILSLIDHYQHIEMINKLKITDPELYEVIDFHTTYHSLFVFVLTIGFYEMITKPSWFKTVVRLFLICIIVGTQLSGLIPIDEFYYGVYNTAWFSAVLAFIFALWKTVKNADDKWAEKKKASR